MCIFGQDTWYCIRKSKDLPVLMGNTCSKRLVNKERMVEERRIWVEEFLVVLVLLVNKNALVIIDSTL